MSMLNFKIFLILQIKISVIKIKKYNRFSATLFMTNRKITTNMMFQNNTPSYKYLGLDNA